jgi:hypothetical protein
MPRRNRNINGDYEYFIVEPVMGRDGPVENKAGNSRLLMFKLPSGDVKLWVPKKVSKFKKKPTGTSMMVPTWWVKNQPELR